MFPCVLQSSSIVTDFQTLFTVQRCLGGIRCSASFQRTQQLFILKQYERLKFQFSLTDSFEDIFTFFLGGEGGGGGGKETTTTNKQKRKPKDLCLCVICIHKSNNNWNNNLPSCRPSNNPSGPFLLDKKLKAKAESDK